MIHTAADIANFHRTLHRLCGLPELVPTVTDQMKWEAFLWEMEPIKDTAGGPFVLADLTAVLCEMQRQKRAGAKWSMKPITILRDPEKFRDMVLTARTSLRIAHRTADRKQSRPAVQHLANGTSRITDDPEPQPEGIPAGEAAAATFAELRKKAGL